MGLFARLFTGARNLLGRPGTHGLVRRLAPNEHERVGLSRNIALGLVAPMLINATLVPPEERAAAVTRDVAIFYATMGMRNQVRIALWSTALAMSTAFNGMARGVVNSYRNTIESRTSAAVPFSHSTVSMDQAYSALQYAKHRLGNAYGAFSGSEATMFASRYMQR